MTYKEKEIAKLEGMKDGLIKKLVDECEEINDQIIALRKGTPRKKDSQIYFERGYKKGMTDAIDEFARLIHKDLYQLNHHQVDFLAEYLKSQYTDEREIQNVLLFKEMVKEQKNV